MPLAARRPDPALAAVAALCAAVPAALLAATASRPLWLDEAASASLAGLPSDSFRRVLLDREGNGLLHTVLLRGWREVLPSDNGLRVPSVLAAAVAAGLLVLLAHRLLGRRAALLAGPLLVANPVFVRYAVEARSYALLLALAVASGLLLDRAVRRPGTAAWVAYAAVSGVAVYAHYFAVLMVAGHVLALLLRRPPGVGPRVLLPAAATYLVAVSGLPRLMTDDAASGVGYLAGSPLAAVVPVGLALVGLAVVVATVVVVRRARAGLAVPLQVSERGWPYLLLGCWALVPAVLAVVLSAVRTPVLAPRYLIVCLPPVVLLLAAGLSRLRARWSVPAVAAAVVLGLAAGGLYLQKQDEDWDDVVAAVRAQAGPEDRVLFVAPFVRIPFDRYAAAAPPAAPPAYPDVGWGEDLAPLFFFTPMPPEQVRPAVAPAQEVFLVVSHVGLYGADDPAYAEVAGALDGRFRLAQEQSFRGVVLQRWTRT